MVSYSDADDAYDVFLKPMLSMHRGMHEEVVRLPRHAVTILVNPTASNWKEAWSYEYFQGFRPFIDTDDLLPGAASDEHQDYYASAGGSPKRVREDEHEHGSGIQGATQV